MKDTTSHHANKNEYYLVSEVIANRISKLPRQKMDTCDSNSSLTSDEMNILRNGSAGNSKCAQKSFTAAKQIFSTAIISGGSNMLECTDAYSS